MNECIIQTKHIRTTSYKLSAVNDINIPIHHFKFRNKTQLTRVSSALLLRQCAVAVLARRQAVGAHRVLRHVVTILLLREALRVHRAAVRRQPRAHAALAFPVCSSGRVVGELVAQLLLVVRRDGAAAEYDVGLVVGRLRLAGRLLLLGEGRVCRRDFPVLVRRRREVERHLLLLGGELLRRAVLAAGYFPERRLFRRRSSVPLLGLARRHARVRLGGDGGGGLDLDLLLGGSGKVEVVQTTVFPRPRVVGVELVVGGRCGQVRVENAVFGRLGEEGKSRVGGRRGGVRVDLVMQPSCWKIIFVNFK